MTGEGTLFGVGVGPGDPELISIKAARLIGAADVIAYHSARHGRSIARSIAEPYLRVSGGGDPQIEEPLIYPVTTEGVSYSDEYQDAMESFYVSAAERLAVHLEAGRDVVVLAEGDPFFYGSYMHLHKRLSRRFATEVVPGITSVSAAAAALGQPLVERDEVLTVLPGILPASDLAARLASTDAAVVMKLGRTFEAVREGFSRSGRLDEARYVERASMPGERLAPLADVDPDQVPYFSLAILPGPLNPVSPARNADPADPADSAMLSTVGEVVVVGLGPGPREWTTPDVQRALSEADDLVGYITYLNRVPANPRQQRHASDNKVESERAVFALDLACRGRRVAVVSSGDPGIFAMASAVLELADEPEYKDVPVRVLPGVSAAQAVAARVGAPLGHDFCSLSLSDRLKPWPVVEQRLDAAAGADLVIALYNPASKERRHQVAQARDIILRHRDPATPVVIGRAVGSDQESVSVVQLGDLDPAVVDMRTLLIIGSSQTRVMARADGSTAVYTPRRYPS